MQSSSMHAIGVGREGTSEPQSTCMASPNESWKINRHKNSSSSNGFNYNFQSANKDAGTRVSQAASAALPWEHMDLEVSKIPMRKTTFKSDLKKTVPTRHLHLLDCVQESTVKANIAVNSSHMCKYCKRHFSSGRALGGHMRAHGYQFAIQGTTHVNIESTDKDQLSGTIGDKLHTNSNPSSENHARSLPSVDSHMPPSAWVQFKECNESRSDFQRRGAFQAKSFEDLAMREEEDAISVRGSSSSEANNDIEPSPEEEFPNDKALSAEDKVYPLYALRRNPKRSRRFTDQQFAFDAAVTIQISSPTAKRPSSPSPERIRACSECGKEFLSWKALFGHMRCHPEREWRGIQPPDSIGQQDKSGNSSGLAARKRRPAVYGIVGKDSGLKLNSDLENSKEREEPEASYKAEEASCKKMGLEDKTVKTDGPIGKEGGEEEASNKRGEGVSSNTKREQEEEVNTRTVITRGEQERVSNQKERKFLDNESDLESIQGGCTNTWSNRNFHGWNTGKRSKRSRHTVRPLQIVTYQDPQLDAGTTPTEIKEERDMADCLVMLAYAGRSLEEVGRTQRQLTEESAFSDSVRNWMYEQGSQRTEEDSEEEEMNWIGKSGKDLQRSGAHNEVNEVSMCDDGDRMGQVNDVRQRVHGDSLFKYECTTCKRVFNSHQALGGHRASHRRVKGCFAKTSTGEEVHESADEDITDDEYLKLENELPKDPQLAHGKGGERSYGLQWSDGLRTMAATAARKSKGHECSICHRVFASGQALGGHKRCHWAGERTTETSVASSSKQTSSIPGGQIRVGKEDFLDLNLPAPLDDDDMGVAYDRAEVVPTYSSFLDAKRAEVMQVHGSTGVEKDHDAISQGGQQKEETHLVDTLSVNVESRWEGDVEVGGSCELGRRNGQVQLNFGSSFLQCNVCDSLFTSLEALSNHQKTHASLMSSVTGLTPISA